MGVSLLLDLCRSLWLDTVRCKERKTTVVDQMLSLLGARAGEGEGGTRHQYQHPRLDDIVIYGPH
jgi:hypothetical protein